MNQQQQEKAQAYWRANVRLITTLLIIWALVSHVAAILLAKPLSGITFGRIPLSFWFAQQGSMIIFVILIFVYAWRMNKLDREFDVHEE
ncbi:hypothetical protein ARMA_1293 [Ardenticatena maritima]|uniref:Membrane protein n=1 Tax=Ardenticatena maritima TaxID=872965 RepID=A0A0M9UCI4_9CHLR|nr:DUF4212 domain-containing protein [Ardenticatena maritima]KPL89191.1 membrane protein [Ardenticatena maritima]GAP62870.1 hypothetical protein ARMA_1293 [Ardenticatena maritima]